ncbi:hypothetical protein AB0M34_35650 [Nocardia sp. NPDC050193]
MEEIHIRKGESGFPYHIGSDCIEEICEKLLRMDADRIRGVRLIHIPTTTIAAMDSVLSLKQAMNSTVGKNHVGCYYTQQPRLS